MITIHGITTCDTVRRARRWLDEHGVDYRFRDFREQPPTPAELAAWLQQCDWQALLNRRSTTWKGLPAAARDAATDAEAAAALLAAHPTLIKRPVLTGAGDVEIGFDADRYRALFAAR